MSALISLASKYTSANPFPVGDFAKPDVRWAVLWAKYLSAKAVVDQLDKTGYSKTNAATASQKLTTFAEQNADSWIPESVSRLISTTVKTPISSRDLRDLILNQFFAAAEAMRLHEVDRASKLIAQGIMSNDELIRDFSARLRIFSVIEDLNKKKALESIKGVYSPVPLGEPITIGISAAVLAVVLALIVVAGIVACIVMMYEIERKNQFAREQCRINPNSLACVQAVKELSSVSKGITEMGGDILKYVLIGGAIYLGANMLLAKAQGAAISRAIRR